MPFASLRNRGRDVLRDRRSFLPLMVIVGGLVIVAATLSTPSKRLDGSKLQLTFDETFQGASLDIWDPVTNPKGRWKTNLISGSQTGDNAHSSRTLSPNENKQIWVDPAFPGRGGDQPLGLNPFTVDEGGLTIRAWPTPPELKDRLWGFDYVSGMISTQTSMAQLYGYFEITARWPGGQGAHPTFWLLPTDGSWPPELDIAEQIGNPRETYLTAHFTGPNGKADQSQIKVLGDTSAQDVTFGVLWTHETISWYRNGVLMRSIRNPGMDKPSYMLCTFEIGGIWPKDPDETTNWPLEWKIKRIRAYALKS